MGSSRLVMTIKIYLICLFSSRLSVESDQWDVGTWSPDLVTNRSITEPTVSPSASNPSTISPSIIVRESFSQSQNPSLGEEQAEPSSAPSDSPSSIPSSRPSVSLSPSVSFAPFAVTSLPSSPPSMMPSSSPSHECHDQVSYRSPLNSLNCTQHFGTDCFQWKHLGLTPTEVEVLINSCPVTCDVACGSLYAFETNLTYQLLFVDNFLAPESTMLFETSSAEYLTRYILPKNEESKFSLNKVELLSQRILEKVGPRRQLRTLQATDSNFVDLEVIVAFQGFVLDLNLATVESYIYEGIETFGYMRALRFTNDPALQDVEVRLESNVNEVNTTTIGAEIVHVKQSNTSAWIISVTVCAGAGIAAFIVVYIRFQKNTPSTSNVKEYDSPVVSPAASARSNVLIGPNFSFDSVSRLAAVGLISRAGTSTSFVGSTGDDDSSLKSTSVASMQSTTESGEDEHPLAGVIPPMIVYDYIDANDETTMPESSIPNENLKNVVPSRHIAATASFRKALEANSLAALDESMFAGIPDAIIPVDATEKLTGSKTTRDRSSLPKEFSKNEVIALPNIPIVKLRIGDREPQDVSDLSQSHSLELRTFHTGSNVKGGASDIPTDRKFHRHTTYSQHLAKEGYQVLVNAPRIGTLGLVIQSTESYGHVVIQVKDNSPLKGKILRGDRIVSIGGQDTTGMSLKKVTNLISGSNDDITNQESTIQIFVWRPHRSSMQGTLQTTINAGIPPQPESKIFGHKRSISGSSMRSTASPPSVGSHRSHPDYHYNSTSHRSRKSTSQSSRTELNRYGNSSQGSTRSSSSAPHTLNSIGSKRSMKLPSETSRRHATLSDYNPSTASLSVAHRRKIPPTNMTSSRTKQKIPSTPFANEC